MRFCRISGKFCSCEPPCEPDDYFRDEPIIGVDGMTQDQRLDDPRRGQAEHINRRPG